MNDEDVFKNPCAVCRKRVATKLCDYVVGYDRSILFVRNYKKFAELNNGTRHETCDLPICEHCSSKIKNQNDIDFCPHHFDLYNQSKLPDYLEQKRSRM